MQEFTDHVRKGYELSDDQVEAAVALLVDEAVEEAGKADFLHSLREKGEAASEIAAFVRSMLKLAVDPGIDQTGLSGPAIDVCGTGGDRMDLFNVSTTAMFVLAAGGASVIKHGNRGITSKSGGADVLEALGVRIDLPPDAMRQCVQKTGIGFAFAPHYHPAFKAIVPVRKALAARGIPTVFNLLGPLLNPARPDYQLVGVFSDAAASKIAETLSLLGRKKAWVVHGTTADGRGVDEFSTMGPTRVLKVAPGGIEDVTLDAVELGLPRALPDDLKGGDRDANAALTTAILSGAMRGPKRDIVQLNAAAAFVITGLAADLQTGIAMAAEQIDSGRALAKLEELKAFQPQ
jgi:anthranilate phosphoribosyltransferase